MIRDVTAADVAALYAHHVLTGVASYETEPPTAEEMRGRIARVLAAGWLWLVAEVDGAVAGDAYATRMRDRGAYRHTAENIVYVAAQHARRGIGRGLLAPLIVRAEVAGFRQMVAVIGGADPASIALHAAAGFRHAGRLEPAGRKHDRWLDSVYMQRALGPGAAADSE